MYIYIERKIVEIIPILLSLQTLLGTPAITRQPVDFSVSLGANVTNVAAASSTLPLTYQWLFNDANLAEATSRTLVLTNIQLANSGSYALVATDSSGSVTSRVAHLSVDPSFTKMTTLNIVTNYAGGAGVIWVDINADGQLDLFVSRWFTKDEIFLNHGDGSFDRSTAAQAGSILTINSEGDSSWADYDNDGLPDAYLAAWQNSKSGRLYHNEGGGAFKEITTIAPVSSTAYPSGPTWGDYDNDGYLDLYIGVGWIQKAGKGLLFHNNGDGSFTRITDPAAGPIVTDSGYAGRCYWIDYDGDGDVDLFQANVRGKSAIYRNDGKGVFTKVASSALVTVSNCYSAAWGDFDNDGFQDVFLQVLSYPSSSGPSQKNHLFRNSGDGTFVEITNTVLSEEALRSFHAGWADYDNDGFLDLFLSGDRNNRLYHNNGDGTFTRILSGSLANDTAQSWDMAWGDYDNDGFMDLIVGNGASSFPEPSFLYRNMGNANHWLKLDLHGTVSNRSALGAKIRVKATIKGEPVWQMREISAFTDHGDLRPNFGLGDASFAEMVRIEWPSGQIQEIPNLAADHIFSIQEPPIIAGIKAADGKVELTVRGWKGFTYAIEASIDLGQWTRIGVVQNLTGVLQITDAAATEPRRFYRLIVP